MGKTLLAGEGEALDEALRGELSAKAREGRLRVEDLKGCFRLFCMVCNRVDELRFELGGFSGGYQLDVGDEAYALEFRTGACSAYAGRIDLPDISIRMETELALALLMGRVNSGAAHMNGEIQYKGTKNSAVKLQGLFELFLDELGA